MLAKLPVPKSSLYLIYKNSVNKIALDNIQQEDLYSIGMWNKIPNDKIIEKTKKALEKNGISVFVTNTEEQAKRKALDLIPKGSEVITMSSVTLDTLGISKEINESGRFNSVKNKLMLLDRNTQKKEMNRLGAAPEFAIGSVHAVTEDGHVIIASNTGSQLPAYVYAAGKVIWVAGAQKIVRDTDEGIKRIYEHTFPLEDKRMQKAYGFHSFVSKLLIINREIVPERIILIFVKKSIGF